MFTFRPDRPRALDAQTVPTTGDHHVPPIEFLELEAASRWKLFRARHLCRSRRRHSPGKPGVERAGEFCRGCAVVSRRDAYRLRRKTLLAEQRTQLPAGLPSRLRRQVLLAK